MASIPRSTVVAVFNSRNQAESAVDELQRAGFNRDQIGVVARDAEGQARAQRKEGEDTYAEEGAVAGAAAGAGVAALVSLGMTFGVIPVIGPILAVGPLAAALLSAAGGAAAGGLAGGLIGWGIPEEEAKYYEGEVKAGRYLVTVRADGRSDEAWNILHRCGGYNRETAGSAAGAGKVRR
jgi:Heat induced stress protein YflT